MILPQELITVQIELVNRSENIFGSETRIVASAFYSKKGGTKVLEGCERERLRQTKRSRAEQQMLMNWQDREYLG